MAHLLAYNKLRTVGADLKSSGKYGPPPEEEEVHEGDAVLIRYNGEEYAVISRDKLPFYKGELIIDLRVKLGPVGGGTDAERAELEAKVRSQRQYLHASFQSAFAEVLKIGLLSFVIGTSPEAGGKFKPALRLPFNSGLALAASFSALTVPEEILAGFGTFVDARQSAVDAAAAATAAAKAKVKTGARSGAIQPLATTQKAGGKKRKAAHEAEEVEELEVEEPTLVEE